MPVEYEFKWLMSEQVISILENCIVHNIEQYYLPSGKDFVARIRKSNDLYFYTVKYNIDGKNIEIEKEISKSDYIRLKSVTKFGLKKKRYCFNEYEIDFISLNNGKTICICELELIEDQSRPQLPDCLEKFKIKEIEYNSNEYSNFSLSQL